MVIIERRSKEEKAKKERRWIRTFFRNLVEKISNENFENIFKDGDMADVDKQIDEFQMENELAG